MYNLYRRVSRLKILLLVFLMFLNCAIVHIRATQQNEVTGKHTTSGAQTTLPYLFHLHNALSESVTSPEAFHMKTTELYPSFISEEGLHSPGPKTNTFTVNEPTLSSLFQAGSSGTNRNLPSALNQGHKVSDLVASDLISSSRPYFAEQSSHDPHIISVLFTSPLPVNAKHTGDQTVSVVVTEVYGEIKNFTGGASTSEGITATSSKLLISDLNKFPGFVEEISGINVSTSSQQKFNEDINVLSTVIMISNNQSTSVKMSPVSSITWSDLKSHSHDDLMKLNDTYATSTCVSCYYAVTHYSGSPQPQEANKTGNMKDKPVFARATYDDLKDKHFALISHYSTILSLLETSVSGNVTRHVISTVAGQIKSTQVQNVLDDLSSAKQSVTGTAVHVATGVNDRNITAHDNVANISGINTPRMVPDVAIGSYQLTGNQFLDRNVNILHRNYKSTDADNESGDLRCPIHLLETVSHKFMIKFLVLENASLQVDLPKTFEITLRKALNDSNCHSVVRMSFVDGQPFTFTWTDASLNSLSCPQSEIRQIYKKMVDQSNFTTAFLPDFQIVDIIVENVGMCSTKLNGVHITLILLSLSVIILAIAVSLRVFISRKNSRTLKHRDNFILRPRSPLIFADEIVFATFKELDAQINREISYNNNSSNSNICMKILKKSKALTEEINEQISDINVCINCDVRRPCDSHMCSTPKNV